MNFSITEQAVESRQIALGRAGFWWSLGIGLTQLSTEIHFGLCSEAIG